MGSPRREWRLHNGVQEVKCASCGAFKPADRKNFYIQKLPNGRLTPASWCKPCYLTNTGRAEGMGIRNKEPAEVPAGIVEAQSAFLRIPARLKAALAPAPLGFGLELRP